MSRKSSLPLIVSAIRQGKIGVMPTDTIYGIVGSALKRNTVEQIYKLRKRNPKKPMIVLIGDVRDLAQFGILLDTGAKKFLKKIWPGKVSVILAQNPKRAAATGKFRYLHRGTKTLAFRLPKPAWLRALLKKTGPLVAPSANVEGAPPARTLRAAKRYFKDKIAFYSDGGRLVSEPSTLVKIERGRLSIVRQGAAAIPKL